MDSISRLSKRYGGRAVIVLNRTAKNVKGCGESGELPESTESVAKELKSFLEDELKFRVDFEMDVDDRRMENLVSILTKENYHCHQVIIFFYIGHGLKGELLPPKESSGSVTKVVDLIKSFYKEDKRHLLETPILIFLDCCQGNLEDSGVPMGPGSEVLHDEIYKCVDKITKQVPAGGNLLVAHSTLPMLKAFSDPNEGPHFTRELIAQLRKNQSIADALGKTKKEVSKINSGSKLDHKFQSPWYVTTCAPINLYQMGRALKTQSFMPESESGFVDDCAPDGLAVPPHANPPQNFKDLVVSTDSDPAIQTMKKEIIDLQGEIKKLNNQIAEKEREIHSMKEACDQRLAEREIVLKEAQKETARLKLDNQKLKDEMQSRETLYEKDVKALEVKKESECLKLLLDHEKATSKVNLEVSELKQQVLEKQAEIETLKRKEVEKQLEEKQKDLEELLRRPLTHGTCLTM